MEKRAHSRIEASFDAAWSADRQEGSGVLFDLSRSGARLEDTSRQPSVGTRVRIYIYVDSIRPFAIVGEVVRHTGSGFAVKYDPASEEVCALVDRVATVVERSSLGGSG